MLHSVSVPTIGIAKCSHIWMNTRNSVILAAMYKQQMHSLLVNFKNKSFSYNSTFNFNHHKTGYFRASTQFKFSDRENSTLLNTK